MKVLLLGGGGREHALGWKLAESPEVTTLLAAPGNPGLAALGPVFPGFDPTDVMAVVDLALANAADLVVVGPEAPLAAGVVDALAEVGVAAFGPTKDAARLETSKAFAKQVMTRARVPTAAAAVFDDARAAHAHLEAQAPPYVVKADGLAAGKGVLVTDDLAAARAWVERCLAGGFGAGSRTVVVEEYLAGPEISVFAICDGERALGLQPARDYKRLGDGDVGPNTGGMGAYSPVDDVPADLVAWTLDHVVVPTTAALAEEGTPYRGILYVGLVLTADGPKVLEFNARLGDPECQVLMPRLEEDLAVLFAEAAAGGLEAAPLRWSDRAAVDVVLASPGYPEAPETGAPITGLEDVARLGDVLVFHAGTRRTAEGVVTAGGRVLNVVGLGGDRAEARRRAYEAVELVDFPGKRFRRDIAE